MRIIIEESRVKDEQLHPGFDSTKKLLFIWLCQGLPIGFKPETNYKYSISTDYIVVTSFIFFIRLENCIQAF